jgi:NADH-quinone oxidoreductase subunit L
MTAFYMFRLYHMTFTGAFRGTHEQEHHVHESPPSMIVPLQVLAVGSVVAGFFGIPAVIDVFKVGNAVEHFLEPVFEPAHEALAEAFSGPVPSHGVELGLMVLSVVLAIAGILVARYLYQSRPEVPARLVASVSGLHRLLLHKYYVDEFYGSVFVRGAALGGGRTLHGMDRYLVDGGDGEVRPGLGVNGIAWVTRDILARLSNFWDKWVVDGAVNLTAFLLDNLSYVFRAVQNGLVQHYALSMLIGVFLLIFAGRFLLGLY